MDGSLLAAALIAGTTAVRGICRIAVEFIRARPATYLARSELESVRQGNQPSVRQSLSITYREPRQPNRPLLPRLFGKPKA